LKSQLNSQREQSATSNELFRKELSTAKNSLTTSIADIATSSHNEHKTLERDLQARAATLNSLIDDCRKELTSLIDTHIKKLDAKKLDRGALSGMFTSVAAELNPGSADAAAEDALADNS